MKQKMIAAMLCAALTMTLAAGCSNSAGEMEIENTEDTEEEVSSADDAISSSITDEDLAEEEGTDIDALSDSEEDDSEDLSDSLPIRARSYQIVDGEEQLLSETEYEYDESGRLINTTLSTSSYEYSAAYTYDSLGNVISVSSTTNDLDNNTEYLIDYDSDLHILCIDVTDTSAGIAGTINTTTGEKLSQQQVTTTETDTWSFEYNDEGTISSISIDSEDAVFSFAYDDAARLSEMDMTSDGEYGQILISYDDSGCLSEVKSAEENVPILTYLYTGIIDILMSNEVLYAWMSQSSASEFLDEFLEHTSYFYGCWAVSFEHDANGEVAAYTRFFTEDNYMSDVNGELLESITVDVAGNTEYSYDEYGRKIESRIVEGAYGSVTYWEYEEEETYISASDASDQQEGSMVLASTYVVTSSGTETLYETVKYTDGVITETWTDLCAMKNVTDEDSGYTYYVETAEYNENGDLLSAESHDIWDGPQENYHDFDTVTECEYEYDSFGNPVSVYIVEYSTTEENGTKGTSESYTNLTLTYNEDNSLDSVYEEIGYVAEDGSSSLACSLSLQFVESADSCAMTIAMEYDENEFLWDVLYEFDADGNIVKISCDGGASVLYASLVPNALNYCNTTTGYCDSYLSILLTSGGSVSYQYNDEGDCIYRQLEYKDDSGVNIIGSTSVAYEYEYIYDDDGNLSQKTKSSEEDDYYLITYFF